MGQNRRGAEAAYYSSSRLIVDGAQVEGSAYGGNFLTTSNTLASSAINLTGALYLDLVGQISAGTASKITPSIFYVKPMDS